MPATKVRERMRTYALTYLTQTILQPTYSQEQSHHIGTSNRSSPHEPKPITISPKAAMRHANSKTRAPKPNQINDYLVRTLHFRARSDCSDVVGKRALLSSAGGIIRCMQKATT
jgi:hypothetical protein